MGEDAEEGLTALGVLAAGAEGRAQPPLVPRDRALDLPALAVDAAVESTLHLPSVFGVRPLPPRPPRVEVDHRRTHAELFTRQRVVMLGVVARVGQQPVDRHRPPCATHRLCELRRVLARTVAHHRARPQVRGTVAHHRELRPRIPQEPFGTRAFDVIPRDMTALQPRRVDARFGRLVDQAETLGFIEDSVEQPIERPPLRSRFSA